MDKWEYRICIALDTDLDKVNDLGSDGWELVSVMPHKFNYGHRLGPLETEDKIFYFKRKLS